MEKNLKKIKQKTYCKNCEMEIEQLWICKMDSIIGIRYALLCSACQTLIGIYCSIDFNVSAKAQYINSGNVRTQTPMN
jgi:hypothetical protein